jgi:hypothetical protein
MIAIRRCLTLLVYGLLSGCGGGGSSSPVSSTNTQQTPLAPSNWAWDHARAYKPFSTSPVPVSQLEGMPPGPVAISLHGCDGVNDTTDPYYPPIFLASLGYLVIEPDSYFQTNDLKCVGFNIPLAASLGLPYRVKDAEYAVAKVLGSSYFDKKTLLVQGQSQGALVLSLAPNLKGATKILWTGYPCVNVDDWWLRGVPKMLMFSFQDPWGAVANCPRYADWDIHILPGSEHNPLRDPAGRALITQFLKLTP